MQTHTLAHTKRQLLEADYNLANNNTTQARKRVIQAQRTYYATFARQAKQIYITPIANELRARNLLKRATQNKRAGITHTQARAQRAYYKYHTQANIWRSAYAHTHPPTTAPNSPQPTLNPNTAEWEYPT